MDRRKEFEQWWAAEFIKSGSQVMIDDDFRKDADGQYEKVIVRRAWLAYREACRRHAPSKGDTQ